MQSQPAKRDAECIGVSALKQNETELEGAEFDVGFTDDDEASSEHWESRVGRPPGDEAAVARLARARIACDLLLARLYKYHPDHALAHLRGIEPHVVDLDVPIAPDIGSAQGSDEKTAEQLRGTPDISLIVQKVANFYGVSVAELCSHKRTAALAESRHVAMYLARDLTNCPLTVIGARLGGRDHTTVHHSIRKVERLLTANASVKAEIETIANQIRAVMLPKVQPASSVTGL
jgi:Bacterial dnaA protein helix-turn-helix